MIKIIALVVLVAIAGVPTFAATQPDTFRVERAASIKAPPEKVFALAPKDDMTNVTWVMQGPAPFVSKVMQVFVSMDKMVGGDFETGLANLKAAAEK